MRWQDAIHTRHDFVGTKLALLLGDDLLVYKRDEKPTIPHPGCWDLPGGGREGDETPSECGARELGEEFALPLDRARLRFGRAYPSQSRAGSRAWFLVGDLTPAAVAAIRFGEEGQEWRLMPVAAFLREAGAVGYLKDRLADYMGAGRPSTVG